MKTFVAVSLALGLLVGVTASALAADPVSVNGKVMCAKCTLKKADAKECQDVLVAKDAQGATVEYYLVKNAVQEKFGHVCTGEKPASVTGTVTEKDGKKWLEATKMTEVK
ncbi:MAG: DUF6370 family protein [Rhodospirillaceae bacterium]